VAYRVSKEAQLSAPTKQLYPGEKPSTSHSLHTHLATASLYDLLTPITVNWDDTHLARSLPSVPF